MPASSRRLARPNWRFTRCPLHQGTMAKRVLDVGQCSPDHASICALIEAHFDAVVVETRQVDDTFDALRDGNVDLVLVNRKLDADDSDGDRRRSETAN